jgi:hypothetical protein
MAFHSSLKDDFLEQDHLRFKKRSVLLRLLQGKAPHQG